jgi:RNA polymerase sigma factor (TIGR02999 family)
MSLAPGDVTRRLSEYRSGKREALDLLMPFVYGELRSLAARYLRAERSDHTLQPTALVHEAYVRLADQRDVEWRNRAHFLGVASQIMRRLLVDHARTRGRRKRGCGLKVPIEDIDALAPGGTDVEVVALDAALERLAALSPTQARIVELRYFGGLSLEETAQVLGVSTMTVKRGWAMARAWLHRSLTGDVP